jgi:hypothetical protein
MGRKNLLAVTGLAILWSTSALADVVVLWDGTGATDTTTWGQLGSDGTVIPNGAVATSAGGNTMSLRFGGPQGLTSVQCPAAPQCSWTGGFTPGETLVWANDGPPNYSGTGPFQLNFNGSLGAAGLAVQPDAPGTFTAEAQVIFTDSSHSSIFSLNSDPGGDPLFIGLQDINGNNIAAIAFEVINSNSNSDFASGTLSMMEGGTTVPEPKFGFLLLAAFPLIGFGVQRLRRLARQ